MDIDALKSFILSTLNIIQQPTEIDNQEISETGVNEQNSLFDNNGNNIEEVIGDVFSSCDSNGDGNINAEEIMQLELKLSAIDGFNANVLSIIPEFSETIKPAEGQELTPEEKVKLQQDYTSALIENDDLISDEVKTQYMENQTSLTEKQTRILELEEKIDSLTEEELAELQKLTEEEALLLTTRTELENSILENCNEDTKAAIQELQKLRSTKDLQESGEEINPETGDIVEANDNKNVGGNTGTGGGYFPNNNGGNENQNNVNNLENKTIAELKTELNSANTTLSEKQTALNEIINETNPELTALKEAETTAYENLQQVLKEASPELAAKLDELTTTKNSKEEEIRNKEIEIQNKKSDITKCEQSFENASNKVQSLETSISALETAQNSATNEEEKTEISEKLSAAKEALVTAKKEKSDAQTALNTAKSELTTLETELGTLKSGLAETETQITDVNSQITALNNSEVTAAQDAYKAAQEAFDTKKTSLLNSAQAAVTEAQNKVTEIEKIINKKEIQEQEAKYSLSDLKGTYNLNGIEYKTLLDSGELESLSSKIQNGGAGNKWGHPDKCLSFAYSYGQWIDGKTNTPINGAAANYPDATAYKSYSGTKEEVLAELKRQLDNGQPVVLQVNGNGEGTSRHYVTVVGYNASAGSKLTESDLLILDTYDGLIEGMKNNGKRFMISGKATGRQYDYQLYIRK